jgi:recombination associated protein RdgC
MWFKNLQLFRLTQPFKLTPEELENQLAPHESRPCGSMEMFSYGWAPPLGRDGKMLIHVTNGNIMLCARKEDKVLPAAVVRDFVEDRVAQIEDSQLRKVFRKERQNIRDEVIHDLLPKAFTRSSLTYAYLSPLENWLVVDATSAQKAEDLMSLLRQSLGAIHATPLSVRRSPTTVMTEWLNQASVPADFEIDDECELREPSKEGSIIRCKRQDLSCDEIRTHLSAGKQASRLALRWDERLSFILGDDLSIKRIRFEAVRQEEAAEIEADDAAARFDADFALMSLEISRLLRRLIEVLGGEEHEAYQGKAA